MKVVITGSRGFIGKHLVDGCKDRGIDVIEIDKSIDLDMDITTDNVAKFIPYNADAIVHLAALSTTPYCKNKGYECFNINVMGTLNLMNIAEERGINQFIFASSEWVYNESDEIKTEESKIDSTKLTSEYALSKLTSEINLKQKHEHGFCPVTILRFGIIYGKRDYYGSAVEVLLGNVRILYNIEVGSLDTGRHFIHISDIISGIIKSLGLKGFNIINLEGDKFVSLREIIDLSKDILNKTPNIMEKDKDNPSIRRVSNEKAKRILGWEPKIDILKGLKMLNE